MFEKLRPRGTKNMFGKKRRQFELACVQFIDSMTGGTVSETAAKLPKHFQTDFIFEHEVQKQVNGKAWPTLEGSENVLLEIFKSKMWWLIKYHDAMFDDNVLKAMKIQRDHLTGNKKLFVYELLELHYRFGNGVLSKVNSERIPSHFEDRVASISKINMPFFDGLLSLDEWVKLPSDEKARSLK